MWKRGGFRFALRLLFLVLLADGALFGALAGAVSARRGARGTARIFTSGRAAESKNQERAVQKNSPGQEASGGKKFVALTFDDGPHAVCTARLLDGLRERGVKVSFFLMGQNIAGNEELVLRMQEEGHLIGNHSFRHVRLTKEGAAAVCESVEKTQELIGSITGRKPEYLRPPYGDWNAELENSLSLTPVFWSVDSLDWKLQDADAIVRRVEADVEDGSIVLLHDIFPTSVEAALRLVDRLSARGYQFVTADELLVD